MPLSFPSLRGPWHGRGVRSLFRFAMFAKTPRGQAEPNLSAGIDECVPLVKDSAVAVHPREQENGRLIDKHNKEILRTINPRIVPLTPNELLVRTLHDFIMVVPGWNIDVGPGIVRDGIIEPWTNEVFLRNLKPGHAVINVGANFGYYALLGASKVGRAGQVYAIEANPAVFPYLVKSAYWGGYTDVIRLYCFAASTPEMHGKEVEFGFDPQFIGGGNVFNGGFMRDLSDCFWSYKNIETTLDDNRRFTPRGVFTSVPTKCCCLDRVVPENVRFNMMLIDAECSECYVIAGAKEIIRRSPELSIIMEWTSQTYSGDRKQPVDDMWTFLLDEMRFQAYRICTDDYPGLGFMPRLEPMNREQLLRAEHSDYLLQRHTP